MEDADIELRETRKVNDDGGQHTPGHSDVNELHLSQTFPDTDNNSTQAENVKVSTPQPGRDVATASRSEEQIQDHPDEPSESRLNSWDRIRFVHIIDATSGDIRDHLALERTWLAYNRTANALASYAVVVAQLFILHEDKRTVGRVCGIVMICGGMTIDVIAAFRFLQQSHALVVKDAATGKSRAVLPTPSLVPCAAIIGGIILGLFILIIVLG